MTSVKYSFLILGYLLISFNCSSRKVSQCDYINISKSLLKKIRANNKNDAMGMMATINDGFWEKGSSWDLIQKNVEQDLSSNYLEKDLTYSLTEFPKALESYAVVSILLRQKGEIRDFLEVRFFSKESPFGCKVETFNFIRTGDSVQVFRKPILDSSKGPSK